MSKITKQITLDVTKPNMMRFVQSKQNDVSSRFLNVILTNEGEVIKVPSDAEVIISAERPDGEKASLHGNVNDNGSVTLPLTGWISEVEGCVRCDISVYDGNEKLSSMTFIIENEGAIITDDEFEDDEDYNEFATLLSSLSDISGTENARILAENARGSAESARASAESERVSAESARVLAENSRSSAESARVSAESARASAESARASAETGRVSAENARVLAENSRSSSENARVLAENARISAENARVSAEALRTTFIPSVSAAGIISWSNDKNLTNPSPVNIKGPAPVRGVDYWTASDIAAIHSYLDTVILGGEW